MESVSLKHVISAAGTTFPVRHSLSPVRIRRIVTHSRHLPLVLHSKKWDFQDFEGYAKPSQLLPASEVKIYEPSSWEQIIESFKLENYGSLYKVKLQTSRINGSSLTDANSGVLLCLIDENSNSILQRIPVSLAKYHFLQSEENENSEVLHFQRGCVDEFIFEGPTLGTIAAIWISVESDHASFIAAAGYYILHLPSVIPLLPTTGQWRLGKLSLTVICQHRSPSAETDEKSMQFRGFQCDFDLEDILLGEGSEFSMTELRPGSVIEFSGKDFAWLKQKALHPSSLGSHSISSEESMKEYADLKFSLLLYDAMLIIAGSSIALCSAGENAALAFLTGGIGGFLYLLLLQRSVDQLPTLELVSTNRTESLDKILRKYKVPLASLVLAFAFAVIAAKYTAGDATRVLTTNDLVFGMVGFLMCRISVVLAALKPMPTGIRGNK